MCTGSCSINMWQIVPRNNDNKYYKGHYSIADRAQLNAISHTVNTTRMNVNQTCCMSSLRLLNVVFLVFFWFFFSFCISSRAIGLIESVISSWGQRAHHHLNWTWAARRWPAVIVAPISPRTHWNNCWPTWFLRNSISFDSISFSMAFSARGKS